MAKPDKLVQPLGKGIAWLPAVVAINVWVWLMALTPQPATCPESLIPSISKVLGMSITLTEYTGPAPSADADKMTPRRQDRNHSSIKGTSRYDDFTTENVTLKL